MYQDEKYLRLNVPKPRVIGSQEVTEEEKRKEKNIFGNLSMKERSMLPKK